MDSLPPLLTSSPFVSKIPGSNIITDIIKERRKEKKKGLFL